MIVVGASWTLMYNADVLLGALGTATRRMRGLAPVLKMSMAYPLRSLFRTGVTLAMFTLVVFTLVVGATTSSAFGNAFNDRDAFGGGFDVRATGSPAAPIADMTSAVAHASRLRPADFRAVASISTLAVKARQLGTSGKEASYVVHGADGAFLRNTTYRLAAWARGYSSSEAVWSAIRTRSQPGGGRPVRRAAPRELDVRDCSRVQAEGLLPRGPGRSTRSAWPSATSRRGSASS